LPWQGVVGVLNEALNDLWSRQHRGLPRPVWLPEPRTGAPSR
jgi:hypothetical protein